MLTRVQVILTVFNAGEFLPQAIASVLGQSFDGWELFIMDDGSTDPLVCAALDAVDDERVWIFPQHPTDEERAGSCRYATLINLAAGRCDADCVTFLCGDDYYLPDRLERMVDLLDEGHDVVYGSQLLLNEHGDETGSRATLGVLDDAYELVDLNSVMMRRAAFDAAGGFPADPGIWRNADAHMWRRLANAGFRFVPVDGGPTDAKRYRADSVDMRVRAGAVPWA